MSFFDKIKALFQKKGPAKESTPEPVPAPEKSRTKRGCKNGGKRFA